jgi:hypothetical protein
MCGVAAKHLFGNGVNVRSVWARRLGAANVGADGGAGADTGGAGGDTAAGGPLSAPAWLPAALTVPADSGWAWEIDPDFEILAASVPSVFIGEDGTYGMLLGEQRGLNTGRALAKVSPPTASLSKPEFLEGVAKVKERIAAGDVYQLVLSVRLDKNVSANESGSRAPRAEEYRVVSC